MSDEQKLQLLDQLAQCFFGSLVSRPSTGKHKHPRSETMRASDGWRHGKSNPFTFAGETYDVLPDLTNEDGKVLAHGSDLTTAQYHKLRRRIEDHA